jgi:hypothetical protein
VKCDTTSCEKQGQGFVKLMGSPFTLELLRDRLAFALLTIIALRARRRQRGLDGLHAGQLDAAVVGPGTWRGMERTCVERRP